MARGTYSLGRLLHSAAVRTGRTIAVFIAALLPLMACTPAEKPQPPVIVISIDTLRSDHLGAYGYKRGQTPAIDRLAKDGIVFEQAFAHVPLTLPSHASIMTGLLPPEHGVRDNAGGRLAPNVPTIATMLRANGYATGAAVSAWVLRASTGIGNGFESYDDRIAFIEGAPLGNLQRDGRETVRAARAFLDGHALQPFFLFVHLFEPHAPYTPSYDGEITKADEAAGELLDAIRQTKRYDDTLIILLSDHGEGLREHGEQEHGVLLYREALQVPMIVKLPRSERSGTRVKHAVQLIDVLPTIAKLTGVTPPAKLRGRSLLDESIDRPAYAETLYPQIHLGWAALHSIIHWPFHLIDGPKPELYQLARNPRETQNVLTSERPTVAKLRADLAAMPRAAAAAPRISDEEAKKLAALGYVSGGASRVTNLNPRDHLRELESLKLVTQLMARRDFPGAARRLEELLVRNPGWSDLRDQLGVAYESMGDLPSAERVYREAIAATPELGPDFALSLGMVLLQQGKLDEAAQHAQVALASNAPAAHELLGEIALARGDFDGAQNEASSIKALPAFELQADYLTARVLAARGELPAALVLLQRIYHESRERKISLPPRYFFVAGTVFAGLKKPVEASEAFQQAILIDRHDRDAYLRLAALQQESGNRSAARTTLAKMAAANPETKKNR